MINIVDNIRPYNWVKMGMMREDVEKITGYEIMLL